MLIWIKPSLVLNAPPGAVEALRGPLRNPEIRRSRAEPAPELRAVAAAVGREGRFDVRGQFEVRRRPGVP